MTMNVTRKTYVFGIVVLAVFTALVLLQKPIAGESSRETDGARLLRGAIDMHFHVDATTPAGTGEQADIGKVRVARRKAPLVAVEFFVLMARTEATHSRSSLSTRYEQR